MLTRRAFLITGVASIAIIGGAGSLAFSSDITKAREPWLATTKGFGDYRLDILAYAILSPNPHNRQPWLVHLDGTDSMTLFCDLNRLLPNTDPFDRQITIGLGAFLELLRLAAAQKGFHVDLDTFPKGESYPRLDNQPIAKITFVKNMQVKKDPLFEYVLKRRTARINFNNKPVENEKLDEINNLAYANSPEDSSLFSFTTDTNRISKLRKLCYKGWEIEATTPSTLNESVQLTRIGAKEVNENPDGISLYGAKFEALKMFGLINRKDMSIIGSDGHKATVSFYNDLISSANAFGWLSTISNTRNDQLYTGAMWLRLNLAATKVGLAMHPLSQVLQEFKEMKEVYESFHDEVGVKLPSRVQGLFRFGYADFPQESPRWPLESRLIKD